MYKIRMEVSKPYDILISREIGKAAGRYIKDVYKNKNIFVVTDQRVADLHLQTLLSGLKSFKVKTVVFEGTEKAKCLDDYAYICGQLIDYGITRGDLLIAFGGGVVGDIVGFIAGTLFRGLPYVQIPTTLLSQVDSAIGGKTGINFMNHKNIIGVFKQPKLVLIDPNFLETLPERELKSGYGEMIKHALIGSPKLFSLLENEVTVTAEIIYENLLVKQKMVMKDEFDRGERMKLNYGHTFGHIIELKNSLLHGEAVLSGILISINLAAKLDLLEDKNLKERVLRLYKRHHLYYIEPEFSTLINEVRYDKKNFGGVINYIIVKKIGEAEIIKITEDDLYESID